MISRASACRPAQSLTLYSLVSASRSAGGRLIVNGAAVIDSGTVGTCADAVALAAISAAPISSVVLVTIGFPKSRICRGPAAAECTGGLLWRTHSKRHD